MKRTFIVLLIIFLLGCSDSFKEEYKRSYGKSFRKSYRVSFIKSCTKSAGGAKFNDVCSCIADDLLESLLVEELKDEKKVVEYVDKVSSGKCIDVY